MCILFTFRRARYLGSHHTSVRARYFIDRNHKLVRDFGHNGVWTNFPTLSSILADARLRKMRFNLLNLPSITEGDKEQLLEWERGCYKIFYYWWTESKSGHVMINNQPALRGTERILHQKLLSPINEIRNNKN